MCYESILSKMPKRVRSDNQDVAILRRRLQESVPVCAICLVDVVLPLRVCSSGHHICATCLSNYLYHKNGAAGKYVINGQRAEYIAQEWDVICPTCQEITGHDIFQRYNSSCSLGPLYALLPWTDNMCNCCTIRISDRIVLARHIFNCFPAPCFWCSTPVVAGSEQEHLNPGVVMSESDAAKCRSCRKTFFPLELKTHTK